jgi:hypothetical protein
VTVLFADLKGSVELLTDRVPEDARAMLDPAVEHMMAAVHREVARWLRQQAVLWWVTADWFMELCALRI